jgi:hypothetical protein
MISRENRYFLDKLLREFLIDLFAKRSRGLGAASPSRARRRETLQTPFHFAQRNMFFFAAILPKRTERIFSHNIPTVNEIRLRQKKFPRCAWKIKSPQPNVPRVHDDAD